MVSIKLVSLKYSPNLYLINNQLHVQSSSACLLPHMATDLVGPTPVFKFPALTDICPKQQILNRVNVERYRAQ